MRKEAAKLPVASAPRSVLQEGRESVNNSRQIGSHPGIPVDLLHRRTTWVYYSMQNEPSGQRAYGSGSGGMSPLTMALLGLIAYKAIKSFSGGQPSTARRIGSPSRYLISARLAPEPARRALLVIC
jgi:hypothetical protein